MTILAQRLVPVLIMAFVLLISAGLAVESFAAALWVLALVPLVAAFVLAAKGYHRRR